ncbi:MAG TPA: hypothetical protein DD491_04820 [Halieaceae bacterium]|nr:hypothetical protein [Halieaceae bacterium]
MCERKSTLSKAISSAFPDCVLQSCTLDLIRYSMQFASRRERNTLAKALRPIYAATSADALDKNARVYSWSLPEGLAALQPAPPKVLCALDRLSCTEGKRSSIWVKVRLS